MTDDTIERVLEEWFGELGPTGLCSKEKAARWWKKDPAFDRYLAETFSTEVEAARNGGLSDWEQTPRGSIAKVLVLDQFPRNIFRGTKEMVQADALAWSLVQRCIDRGIDHELPTLYVTFLYVPLMHQEDLTAQNQCVECFERLLPTVHDDLKPTVEANCKFARQHQEIIERFGRFPHRNEILGRTSSEEEVAFLKTPGSSF